MKKSVLIAFVALSACAVPAPQRPVQLDLSNQLLQVRMSDNQTCRAPRPESGNWAGRFSDCDSEISYEVRGVDRSNPVRIVLEQVLGAVDLEQVLVPEALVTLRAPDGREWLYRSPPTASAR